MDIASHSWHGSAGDMLARLAQADGSAAHPFVRRFSGPGATSTDLADAVHALCAVHGRHPGMIEAALAHCAQPEACDWLERVAAGFAGERTALALLIAAAGPLPSTPGQAESEAALAGVRRAIEMLASSDRGGCATGAAAALVEDWRVVRSVMTAAAGRFAIVLAPCLLPNAADTGAALAALSGAPSVQRAVDFGARQLLAQHRGFWDLMDARAAARG